MPLFRFDSHHPSVADDAFISPTATLVGEVSIHARAVVMFGAVLRADRAAITLGEGSNVQDNAVIHGDPGFPAVVGRDVSIGHGAIVHGATLGDRCLIGMNATVLNGAVIGEGSLIAAGTVILEGTVVPPNSLVAGVPGKIRRETTPEEREHIAANAATYRELALRYRAEL
jgi:carbonic anhydrase/acetyltransferase-like protein (isoleucine patch superfamily)